MSRNGAGLFTLDPRYLVSEGDTILPSQHNPVLEDLQTDANTPRPIVAGGTGASTATTARTNLSVYSIADVDDGFTPKVATRTALKALDTATTKAVVLTEASRQKLFMWMTGDFTDSVAGDTSELAYIPADGIDPALGCWVAVTGAGASIVPVIQGGTGANDAATALDNLGGMASATYDPNGVSGDAFSMDNMVEGTDAKIMTAAERTKLIGVEAGADVTDAANVDAAGATMNTDTDVSGNSWVLDEDDMASDSATKVPTQQSVKAYVGALGLPAIAADTFLRANAAATGYDALTATELVTALNVKALNDDGGFTFDTTATTQDFMPVGTIGGVWKAASVFASSDAETFAGSRSSVAITRTVTGSGSNNPNSDQALSVIVAKDDLDGTAAGEIDAARFWSIQNGVGDSGVLLLGGYKRVGDGSASEGGLTTIEASVRRFTTDLVTYDHWMNNIMGFSPNPTATWGGREPIGFYSENHQGAGFANFVGITDGAEGTTGTLTYLLAGFRTRDIDDRYFSVKSGTGDIESITNAAAGVAGPVWTLNNPGADLAGHIAGRINFQGENANAVGVVYGQIQGVVGDPTAGAAQGYLSLSAIVGNAITEQLRITDGVDVRTNLKVAGAQRIDASGGVRFKSYSAADIGNAAHAVNTTDKAAGKSIWDATNGRILTANGSGATNAWIVANGTVAITPA